MRRRGTARRPSGAFLQEWFREPRLREDTSAEFRILLVGLQGPLGRFEGPLPLELLDPVSSGRADVA